MTTVFGFKHPQVDSGILVADRQSTHLDERGLATGKHLGRKIQASEDNSFCFGHSGYMDNKTYDFTQELASGKYDVEKIVSKGSFLELRKLNISRMGTEIPDNSQISGLLMITRFNGEPHLYNCYPLGKVQEMGWSTIGSGSQEVIKYMDALNVLGEAKDYEDKYNVKMEDVIKVGLEAVRRAQSKDLYSHGLDMLVVTSKGIKDHRADLDDHFGRTLAKIQNKYKPRVPRNKK
jgi:hypothetical protein